MSSTLRVVESEVAAPRESAKPASIERDLTGQWFGDWSAGREGKFILNLERFCGEYSGSLVVREMEPPWPSAVYRIALRSRNANGEVFRGNAAFHNHFDPSNNHCLQLSPDVLRERFPRVDSSHQTLRIDGTLVDGELILHYKSDNGLTGCGRAKLRKPGVSSDVQPLEMTWNAFKRRSFPARTVFRGQLRAFPLRTSFHRAGRTDMFRFFENDVTRLAQHLSALTDEKFEIENKQSLVALMGIAQHHGYRTPLLDWSKSPYVAAYFACHKSLFDDGSEPVVFCFDRKRWECDHGSVAPNLNLLSPMPELTFLDPVQRKNLRVMPQQSVLLYSNVDDLETFIKQEHAKGEPYLERIVLKGKPVSILRDLRMMGISAASLFPGLDGVCQGLSEESLIDST